MLLPWFMHSHGGQNTLVGVLPTPCGTYVRSWKDDFYDVTWYPMGHEFPGGDSRRSWNLGRFVSDATDSIDPAEQAVVDHMHAHPVLCMATSFDPRVEPLEWTDAAEGVSTHSSEDGTWLKVSAGGLVTLSLLPIGGGPRIEIARLSDACSEKSLGKRLAERVMRHRQARIDRLAA